ncbi:hypothetical protein BGZ83_010861 [Gryganskiella cystojenkinii]|nr:hypothetical protein BGZ83_010861 [Gryganskiella cystojenkinii]
MFSPSNGIITPTEAVVGPQQIHTILADPNYSQAFRLVLTPTTPSSTGGPIASGAASTITEPSNANNTNSEKLYRPHLERIRTVLDQELEVNLRAQQQRAEARIEAYKSQQLLALQKSIESTRLEKDRLWSRIMDRVNTPAPELLTHALGESGQVNNHNTNAPADTNGTHPFDGPSTLPIRLTSASRIEGAHSAFLDRRKSSATEAAMSLQFREFDQRMVSNSLRRQSVAPISPTNAAAETSANTAANAISDRHQDPNGLYTSEQGPAVESSSSTSPNQKSKKKVTIADDVTRVSIIDHEKEPRQDEDHVDDEDEADLDDDEGVVFDLDEELGFDDQEGDGSDNDNANDEEDQESSEEEADMSSTHLNGTDSGSSSSAVNISSSGRSLPNKSGMVVGSLRASYLRRQRGLEEHRRALQDDDEDDDAQGDADSDEEDNYEGRSSNVPYAATFGTSLPITIQRRTVNPAPLPPTAQAAALATSLAMPPGTTPAAAMLQRRLSRAYGNDLPEGTQANGAAGSYLDPSFPFGGTGTQPIAGSVPGTMIIDPLMLLEEEHDRDDQADRLRRRKQPFTSINHRRDMEKTRQQQQQSQQPDVSSSFSTSFSQAPVGGSMSTLAAAALSPSAFSGSVLAEDFEPPHLYSARTYIGSTPWERPTRITVKHGGMREGSHLDQQIEREMAKELEEDRKEQAATTALSAETSSSTSQRIVDRVLEEEEAEEESRAKTSVSGTHSLNQVNEGPIG